MTFTNEPTSSEDMESKNWKRHTMTEIEEIGKVFDTFVAKFPKKTHSEKNLETLSKLEKVEDYRNNPFD